MSEIRLKNSSTATKKPPLLEIELLFKAAREKKRLRIESSNIVADTVPATEGANASPPQQMEQHNDVLPNIATLDAPRQPSNRIDLDEPGYLRLPQVLKLLGISRSGFYKGVQDGIYPRQVKLSPNPNSRAVGWPKAALKQLLSDLEG